MSSDFVNDNRTEDSISLGQKIKVARKNANLTQEEMADKLSVSRQAITKWEADKGIPDIQNLKNISKLLNVSIDCLLDDENNSDISVMRESIDLNNYDYKVTLSGRWVKKVGKKDMAVKEKFPDCEIYMLFGEQIPTKSEKVIDNAIGFLTSAPFGIPQFINSVKNTDKEFYLVNKNDKQFLVVVYDEFIESRQLAQPVKDKKFEIGNFKFINLGLIK